MDVEIPCCHAQDNARDQYYMLPWPANPKGRPPTLTAEFCSGCVRHTRWARRFQSLGLVNENRNVASRGKSHMDRMISALPLVELGQAFSKPVCLDPRNCVFASAEYRLGTTQDFGRDVVFIKLVGVARGQLLAHISEQVRQSWPFCQRSQDAL